MAAPAPSKPKKGGSIDDLLDQVGTPRRGGEEPRPKKVATAAALPSLSQSDIVSAMKAVQPRVRSASTSTSFRASRMSAFRWPREDGSLRRRDAGKFAGTPSAACVEAAAKTAKFPPCEAMSFPWPFQLH